MEFIDTHTHLFLEEFDEDRAEVVKNAQAENIQKFFLPNIDSLTISALLDMAEAYPNVCFPMMGLHPGSVNKDFEKELDIVYEYLKKGKFYGVGEIGMDLYWDKTFVEEQKIAFSKQVLWAKEFDLPIIIHARDAFDEIFEVLDKLNDDSLKGIFHCFTGTKEQAERIVNYKNFYLGIGGVVTFKNAGLDKTLAEIPLKYLLLETDSPYLAPTPNRGKRNESAFMIYAAKKLAEIYHCDIEKIAEITTQNAKQIFGIS